MTYCKRCGGASQAVVVFDEDTSLREHESFPVVAIDCPCGYQYVKKGYNISLSEKQRHLL